MVKIVLLFPLLVHLVHLIFAGKDLPEIFHRKPPPDGIRQLLQQLQLGLEVFYHINPSSWS